MSWQVKKISIYLLGLFAFIWCNYIDQALLFKFGGTIVTLVELVLILLIWGLPVSEDISQETWYAHRSLMSVLIIFFIISGIVYMLGYSACSKVTLPFIGVEVPKQIYNGIFNLIFLLGLLKLSIALEYQDRKSAVNIYTFFIVTVALFNIIGVIHNPDLVKKEAASEDGTIFVLGYAFAYVLALSIPLFAHYIKKSQSGKWKWLTFSVLLTVSIYYAGYFIAITAVIVALLVQRILAVKNKVLMGLLAGVLLGVVVYMTLTNGTQEFLIWLANKTNIDVIRGRLNEIVDYMNNGMSVAVEGKTTYRFYIYQDTWKHFLAHPIVGNYIWDIFDGSYDHATLLDLLSNGGIILGGLFLLVLWKGYQFGCTMLSAVESRRTLLACYITYIYLALFNSVLTYRLMGILFVVAPLFLKRSEECNEDFNYTSL